MLHDVQQSLMRIDRSKLAGADLTTSDVLTVYDKDETDDLTMEQRKGLRDRLQLEIKARSAAT